MPYIKRISSIVGKGDNGGAGSKKAGLVYRTDWNRVPGNYLLKNTTNQILDCMLKNCKRIKNKDGTYTTLFMPYTSTYVNPRARNNTK
jgi:hypothetical protein